MLQKNSSLVHNLVLLGRSSIRKRKKFGRSSKGKKKRFGRSFEGKWKSFYHFLPYLRPVLFLFGYIQFSTIRKAKQVVVQEGKGRNLSVSPQNYDQSSSFSLKNYDQSSSVSLQNYDQGVQVAVVRC